MLPANTMLEQMPLFCLLRWDHDEPKHVHGLRVVSASVGLTGVPWTTC